MQASDDALTDEQLLTLIGQGDECALADLYSRFGGVVFGFVFARVLDRELAEEVSADVWLGCWRSARAFRGDSKVLTWLLGIAKRQIVMHTRRKRLPQVPLDDERPDELVADDPGPADLLDSAERMSILLDALDKLPAEMNETVRLAWLHELPYEEIAELSGVPVGTVKSRISRARRILREELRRQDV